MNLPRNILPVDAQVPGDDGGRLGRNPDDVGHWNTALSWPAATMAAAIAVAIAASLTEILSMCLIRGCKKFQESF